MFTFKELRQLLIDFFGDSYKYILADDLIVFDLQNFFPHILRNLPNQGHYLFDIYEFHNLAKKYISDFDESFDEILMNINVYYDLVDLINVYSSFVPKSEVSGVVDVNALLFKEILQDTSSHILDLQNENSKLTDDLKNISNSISKDVDYTDPSLIALKFKYEDINHQLRVNMLKSVSCVNLSKFITLLFGHTRNIQKFRGIN